MTGALIFDVDGVIADTEVLNARASVRMFQQLYGVDVQPEDFRPFVGTGDERYVEGVADKYDVEIDTEAAVQRRADNFFLLLKDQPLPAAPGIMALVTAARDDPELKLAIATSGNKDKQFPVIAGAGLKLEWFDVVVTGDDIIHKTPHPEIYLTTAHKLGLPPEKCVVLEDAPAGVASAGSAGMHCIAVTSSVDAAQLAQADLVVDSLAEVSMKSVRKLLTGKSGRRENR
jgi:cytidine deaminase